jgi:AraC family carnitine catabolism transcriptional activator
MKKAGPLPQIAPRVIAEKKVDTVLAWYSEHMIEMPSLERVSENAGVSSRQMRRYFRMVRNQSPARSFRQLRIQKAEELLSSSNLTADKVAGMCGFGSDSDFSRAFKAHHGESPTQWRRRNRRTYLPGN